VKPPTDTDWLLYLDGPFEKLQKLQKKLRRWLNAGHATPEDLNDASVAVQAIRRIFHRHELNPIDLDRGDNSRSRRIEREGTS